MGFIGAIFRLLFKLLILGSIVFVVAHFIMSQNYSDKVTVKFDDGTKFEMAMPEGWYNHNETALGYVYSLIKKDLREGAFLTPKDCGILCAVKSIQHSLQSKFFNGTAFIQIMKITEEKPLELCKIPERKLQDKVVGIPEGTLHICLRKKDDVTTFVLRIIDNNKNEALLMAAYFNEAQIDPLMKAASEITNNIKITKAE